MPTVLDFESQRFVLLPLHCSTAPITCLSIVLSLVLCAQNSGRALEADAIWIV
jgi:hypothetical protein